MSPGSDSPEFNAILAEILRSEEAGEPRNVEQWCEQHPAYAESIREFFDEREELGLSRVFNALDLPTVLPETEPTQTLRPSEVVRYFGDYEIEDEIARGGMGVVYRARQVSLNRTVALKMILAGELATEDLVTRFRKEAEAAARLDHSGIVPIHEIGQHNDQHYFSMAYVDGSSLADRIASGPLPPIEAAELVASVADALQHAHDNGVIHRDLKPANVLLDNGRPKVTDFGLAKRLDQQSVTATGEVLGTPGYMAPEQASNAEAAGTPSDVYGLGAILYATLTGRPPFQSANIVETLCQLVKDDCVPPRRLNAAVPSDLETICLAALRKDPAKRYASASALAADLRRFVEGRPIQARPVSTLEHVVKWAKRRPLIASLSAALALTIVVGSGIIASLWMDEREARLAASEAAEEARENAAAAVEAREDAMAQKKIAEANLVTTSLSVADLTYAGGDVVGAMDRYLKEFQAAQQHGEGDRRAWWRLWRVFAEYPCERWLPSFAVWVTASPDGRFIAAVNGGEVHVLDGETFENLQTLEMNDASIWRAGFSPDGKYLVVNHFSDPILWLWETDRLDAEPREFTLSVDLDGASQGVLESQLDERMMQLVRKQIHAKPGFGFDDQGRLLAVGASGLWRFDVNAPGSEGEQIAKRKASGIARHPDGGVFGQSGNRYWVSRFGAAFGLPLTLVELGEGGDATHSYPAFVDDELVYLTAPKTPISAAGMSDTWLAFPEDQRQQLMQSEVFAVHPRLLHLALIHNGALSIWDLQSGRKIAQADAASGDETWESTKQLVFSPDGSKLLALGNKARVFEASTLREQHHFDWLGMAGDIMSSAAFSADGTQVLLPDVSDLTKPVRIGVYSAETSQVAVEKAGGDVVFGNLDVAFDIPLSPLTFRSSMIELSSGEGDSKRFPIPKEYRASSSTIPFASSADRSRCVLSVANWQENPFESNLVIGFDTESGELFGPEDFGHTPLGLGLSADGERLVYLESDGLSIRSLPEFTRLGSVNLIRPEWNEERDDETSWAMLAVCGASSSTRPWMATGFTAVLSSEDQSVRFASQKELAIVDIEAQTVLGQRSIPGLTDALFLSDGESIAVSIAGSMSRVEILSLPSLETMATWETRAKSILAMAESPKREIMAIVDEEGRVAIWDRRRKELLAELPLFSATEVVDLRFSEDERELLAASREARYRVDLSVIDSRVESHLTNENGTGPQ
ncbi:MAG: WD40 repeat domain-containing serine/threonine protein kinase [Planctomycetota bacterium]